MQLIADHSKSKSLGLQPTSFIKLLPGQTVRSTVPDLLASVGGVVYPLFEYLKFNSHWQKYTPADVPGLVEQIRQDQHVTGISYRGGPGNLHDFDFDLCKSYRPVETALAALGLPSDYKWVIQTASGEGYRVLFRCADDPTLTATFGEADVIEGQANTADFDHLELRWRHNSVIAGYVRKTKGPDKGQIGQCHFPNGLPAEPPFDVTPAGVKAAFFAVAHLDGKTPKTAVPTRPTSAPIRIEDWQAGKAMEFIQGYLDELKRQSVRRNDFINDRVAWNIGRLAHYIGNDGLLMDMIFDAAITCGYVAKDGETQTRDTIASGFNAGKDKPRHPFSGSSAKAVSSTKVEDLTPRVTNAVPLEPIRLQEPIGTATTTVDTSFLDHFEDGVDDLWMGWLRRMGKYAPMVIFIWIEAIRRGIHDKNASVDGEQLAAYHLAMDIATEDINRETLAQRHEDGLSVLRENGLLGTENCSPGGAPKSCLASLGTATDALHKWAYPRLKQKVYPGYNPNWKDDDPEPVRLDLQEVDLMGEFGADEDEAEQIATNIRANLHPTEDYLTDKRRSDGKTNAQAEQRAKTRLFNRSHALARDLRCRGTVTPLATGARFSDYTALDAARFRGAVEHRGAEVKEWANWQWVAFLGVSRNTVINLRANAGLIATRRIGGDGGTLLLTRKFPVQRQVKDFARKVGGRAIQQKVIDSQTGVIEIEDYSVKAATAHLEAERAVEVLFERSSLTELDPAGPRERKRPAPDGAPKAAGTAPALPKFKPYNGPGVSSRWLWSQIVLNLIAAGYEENEVKYLSLPAALDLAQGKPLTEISVNLRDESSKVFEVVEPPADVIAVPLTSEPPAVAQEIQAMWTPVTEVVEPEPVIEPTIDQDPGQFIPQWNQPSSIIAFAEDYRQALTQDGVSKVTNSLRAQGALAGPTPGDLLRERLSRREAVTA